METRRLMPRGRQLQRWGLTMGAARRRAHVTCAAGREPDNSTERMGLLLPSGEVRATPHGQHGGSISAPLATCQDQKSRQDATGRPKNVRNGVVMWKKRPAVPVTAFLVWGLQCPDAVSLQVFPLVVTRLRPRRCGRCAAIGLWRLLAAIGCVAAAAASGPLARARGVRALPAMGVWLLAASGRVRARTQGASLRAAAGTPGSAVPHGTETSVPRACARWRGHGNRFPVCRLMAHPCHAIRIAEARWPREPLHAWDRAGDARPCTATRQHGNVRIHLQQGAVPCTQSTVPYTR